MKYDNRKKADKLTFPAFPSLSTTSWNEVKKSLPVQTLDEAFGEPEKLEE